MAGAPWKERAHIASRTASLWAAAAPCGGAVVIGWQKKTMQGVMTHSALLKVVIGEQKQREVKLEVARTKVWKDENAVGGGNTLRWLQLSLVSKTERNETGSGEDKGTEG